MGGENIEIKARAERKERRILRLKKKVGSKEILLLILSIPSEMEVVYLNLL